MPRGPRGEKRPGDVIGAAVMVARIATREIEEGVQGPSRPAAEIGRKGGKARAASLHKADRVKIAKKAAKARWKEPEQAK